MIKHRRFAYGVSFLLSAALVAACSVFFAETTFAAPSTPKYTITPGSQIEATGGFLTDGTIDAVFLQEDGKWVLAGAGSTEPRDAANYVNFSKPSVLFKHSENNLYITHVSYTANIDVLFGGPERCYVAIKTNSSNTTASFVGANDDNQQTDACTKRVQDSIAWSSISFTTGTFDGTDVLGVTIPTCTQSPGSDQYSRCVAQRTDALRELRKKIAAECSSSTGGADNCSSYSEIAKCLESNENNSPTHCTQRQDARAILDGDYSSIDASTTDEAIQAICGTLSNNSNKEKCIKKATAERDSLIAKGERGSSCAVQGIGWIVCPVITFIGALNDSAFSLLSSYFLEIESSLIQDSATKEAWEAFRDIANVLFVIAFVIIVYAQMIGGRS